MISIEDGFLKSRFAAVAHLLTGTFAVGAIMAFSTVIAARALGPELYGVLALVLTMGRICERLIRFESWQPLIRFASQPNVERDPQMMGNLFLLGLLLDLACALAASFALIVGGYLLLPVVGLDRSQFYLLVVFAPAIAMNIRGVQTAALRLAGHFRTLAYFQALSAVLRLVLAGLAYLAGWGLTAFLAIWAIAQIIDTVIFAWLARRSLHEIGVKFSLRNSPSELVRMFPGFMSFAWSTNASSSLRTLTQEADTLLVGGLAGPVGAGYYHLAKRFAKLAQQVGQHIQAVLYPDLARLWARKQKDMVGRIALRVQCILASVGAVLIIATWFLAEPMIAFFLGRDFLAVFPLLFTQIVAVTLILHAATPRSALLAMNRPGIVLLTALVSTALFMLVAFSTIPQFGAVGANYAHIAFALVTAVTLDIVFWRTLRRHKAGTPVEKSSDQD